jgi:hypothetical protein
MSTNDVNTLRLQDLADSNLFWAEAQTVLSWAWDRQELIDWAMRRWVVNQATADAAIGMLID